METILIRGGGDIASGVALRLHRSGFKVIISELDLPLAVRRTVSFSEAIYSGDISIESIKGKKSSSISETEDLMRQGIIPVMIDPRAEILSKLTVSALVDARLLKRSVENLTDTVPFLIGLGPGFVCGENCHAVVETQRGHNMGRVLWSGSASSDTGLPEGDPRRVLRSQTEGVIKTYAQIGDFVHQGDLIARIGDESILAPISGMLRGLIRSDIQVAANMKIGDIDPRGEASFCYTVSDKALAVGGGVLEALLSHKLKTGGPV